MEIMACAGLTTLKAMLLVGLLCLTYFTGIHGQIQSTVIALEGTDVQLTLVIPDSSLVNEAPYIAIRLNTGINVTDVMFLINGKPQVKEIYDKLLTANQAGRTVTIQARNVAASLAGTFNCYISSSDTLVANCGQLLIIVRKPNLPTITKMPSSGDLVASRLVLSCETHSTSLPPNHGMASQIWWYDQTGALVSQGRERIEVSAQGQLIIDPLQRVDKGRKFYCISADSTGDVSKEIKSDKSADYEVLPEYKPVSQDFIFTPTLQDIDVVVKEIGQQISYRCEIDCWPLCSIFWMFKPGTASADFVEISSSTDKKELALTVDRTKDGLYKCKGENKHGFAEKGFELKSTYIVAPTITINDESKSNASLPEYSQVNLKCVFDSFPAPVVNWISPIDEKALSSHTAEGPVETVDGDLTRHMFTSSYGSSNLGCEDAGLYKCVGRNIVGSAEGRIQLVITCPPSSANVLGLKEEYVWQISHPLSFEFVIRAFPEPSVTKIISSINGMMRDELMPTDVAISKTPNYNGKSYLTKFAFTSNRNLDLNDANRVYTMTIASPELKNDFAFRILPRGPPHKAINLTAVEVGPDSLFLVWLAGFSGGETQTFSVQYRIGTQSELESGKNYSWTTSSEKIPEDLPGNWFRVKVPSLRADTDYVFRVLAINSLGSSAVEIKMRTAASATSLGAGAICGIVFGVLILLAIIAVVIYFFVFRKKFGTSRGHGGTRKEQILEQISSIFRRDKYKARPATGARMNGSASRESTWGRVRKIFKRSSPRSSTDYLTVPPKDYVLDESSKSAMNNNALSPGTPDSGRKMNNDGLVYVEVEFADGKRKNIKEKPTDKKKKKKKENVQKSSESINYTEIDFSKTVAKSRELEEEERMQEEERRRQEEEEAENGDYENAVPSNKYSDAGFGIGTTV